MRLDPTDAEFVDVSHTDTKTILIKGFGIEERAGHVDIYPNGGFEQPSCRTLENGMCKSQWRFLRGAQGGGTTLVKNAVRFGGLNPPQNLLH